VVALDTFTLSPPISVAKAAHSGSQAKTLSAAKEGSANNASAEPIRTSTIFFSLGS
jgi:hypothetical protein